MTTTTAHTTTCAHGNELTECKCCYKRPYECDHGTCIRKATTTVTNSYGEARRGCAKHAKYMGVAA